ncbi:MAG: hypothetical protein FJ109_14690 [Deltaproteobacteria bacterium]|nr:hypothetical protein [Deltaproteobacteria bacterium]
MHEKRVEQWVRKLSSVPDPQLVEALAAEVLAERPIELLAELLATLGRRGREERVRLVYCAVVRIGLAADSIPEGVRQEVYSVLAARGEAALVRYLLPLPALRSPRGGDQAPDPLLEDMPLGAKKWKARLHNREMLLRLARDGDPRVVSILLDNPLVTEDDVVSWSARRPTTVELLLLVARHRRWSLSMRIQEAVARNPYAPLHVAAAYLPLLTDRVLYSIRSGSAVHRVIRESAEELLALRGRTLCAELPMRLEDGAKEEA